MFRRRNRLESREEHHFGRAIALFTLPLLGKLTIFVVPLFPWERARNLLTSQ